jgi:hypothetical protein
MNKSIKDQFREIGALRFQFHSDDELSAAKQVAEQALGAEFKIDLESPAHRLAVEMGLFDPYNGLAEWHDRRRRLSEKGRKLLELAVRTSRGYST